MKNARLTALFLVSIAGISYELYVMRIFSVGGWSHFGSLVISTALLGIGVSGIILTFMDEWIQLYADSILAVTKIYSAAMGLLALTQLVFPHPYGSDALVLFQITGIPAVAWVFVRHILLSFITELKNGKGFRAALADTYPGNLVIGMGVLVVTIIVDLADALALHYSIGITRYSLCAFVLSVTLMLTRLYGRVNRELAVKSALLERLENPAAAREAVFNAHRLTDREKEAARMIIEGLDNNVIADKMYISRPAVDYHIGNIYRKFNIDGKRGGRAAFLAKVLR